jgi:hypothetical protein
MSIFNKVKEAWKENAQEQKQQQDDKAKRYGKFVGETANEKAILKAKGKYGGGYPGMPKAIDGKVIINKLGFYFSANMNEFFNIPIGDIAKAEYKTEDQLRTDAALARFELFGIFSAGMGSKRSFLLLTYNESGMENKIIFEGQEAPGMVSAIMEARQGYMKEHQAQNTSGSIDIPEQIKKLSELKEQGILSQEEFDTKKKELLNRM